MIVVDIHVLVCHHCCTHVLETWFSQQFGQHVSYHFGSFNVLEYDCVFGVMVSYHVVSYIDMFAAGRCHVVASQLNCGLV